MSNIEVTPGSGKTVSTETISGSEYQRVKIVDGTAAGTTGLKVNSDGSLTVASIVGSLPAGVALLGGITSIIGAISPYAQPDSFVSGVTSIISSISAVSVLAAPGANLRNYITHITATNGSATATYVSIQDSGANVLYRGYAAASGGGFASSFPVPIKQLTTNASVDMITSTQASVIVAISGYKAS